MPPRWILGPLILMLCYLQGCAAGTVAVTPIPSVTVATPIIALPGGCAPLLQYQSIDFRGVSCIAVFCQDGRIVRTTGCSAVPSAPETLAEQQLDRLRERIDKSGFFALEPYYAASTDC